MRLLSYVQQKYSISRRAFVAWVKQGQISVNGQKVDSYTKEIAPWDLLTIKTLKLQIHEPVESISEQKKILILFNKPLGYVVSKSDPNNKTIYELLPKEFQPYYYIWRLDKDSHGLLLLTNDPATVNLYEHPKHGVEKEYIVQLDQDLRLKDIQKAMHGVEDEGELLKAIKISRHKKTSHYLILLNEGKKRHIRRMFKALGYRVQDLQRIREGEYELGNLWEGRWKVIS